MCDRRCQPERPTTPEPGQNQAGRRLPRLRKLRTSAGWTQQQVAEKLLSLAWMRGDRHAGVNGDVVANADFRTGTSALGSRYQSDHELAE